MDQGHPLQHLSAICFHALADLQPGFAIFTLCPVVGNFFSEDRPEEITTCSAQISNKKHMYRELDHYG